MTLEYCFLKSTPAGQLLNNTRVHVLLANRFHNDDILDSDLNMATDGFCYMKRTKNLANPALDRQLHILTVRVIRISLDDTSAPINNPKETHSD
jgi:hypothetical protein